MSSGLEGGVPDLTATARYRPGSSPRTRECARLIGLSEAKRPRQVRPGVAIGAENDNRNGVRCLAAFLNRACNASDALGQHYFEAVDVAGLKVVRNVRDVASLKKDAREDPVHLGSSPARMTPEDERPEIWKVQSGWTDDRTSPKRPSTLQSWTDGLERPTHEESLGSSHRGRGVAVEGHAAASGRRAV